ncbi:MAG TPA: beta-ketoacyl-ACP synthase II [Candidatus Binatia bacterium]|nr:beta-ketoacyl-ACP synthase II [Candidatus Binatia bacterium]
MHATNGTRRRVVVTGLGLVTPLGTGIEKNWDGLVASRSGIRRITRFDASALPAQVAGEVPDFEPERFLERKDLKKMDIFIQYAVAAAQMGMDDAGIPLPLAAPERTGVIVGVGMGGITTVEDAYNNLSGETLRRISPFFILRIIPNMAPGHIALRFGARGPNYTTSSACASGAHAIGEAFLLIRDGRQDMMIAGGSEAPICMLGVGGFSSMRALSTGFNDEPARASRPFDARRDGFVMGEGAGMLVLEELEHARARGATIYAELAGYGATCDAYHMTQPAPEGAGAADCMARALADADIAPVDVGYINAHGTGTPFNDAAETLAVKRVFGEHATKLGISSTKSMTGHLLGAAGAIEAAYTALAVARGILPPTINLDEADPECDLDYVAHAARPAEVEAALSNSFGFGGTNAVLVFRHVRGE